MEQKRRLNRIDRGDRIRRGRLLLEFILGGPVMGEIRVKARLESERDIILKEAGKLGRRKVRFFEIDAVVDTGAVMTLLPQEAVEALGLRSLGTRTALLANDQKIELPCAGGILLAIGDRQMITECLVGPPGCEPLIGQIVMESLDLIPDPRQRTLTPRPESPFRATLKLKTCSLSHDSERPAAAVAVAVGDEVEVDARGYALSRAVGQVPIRRAVGRA